MIINIQKYLSCTYNISLDTLKGKKGIRSKDEYKIYNLSVLMSWLLNPSKRYGVKSLIARHHNCSHMNRVYRLNKLYNNKNFLKNFGYVGQNTELMNDTIRNNIIFSSAENRLTNFECKASSVSEVFQTNNFNNDEVTYTGPRHTIYTFGRSVGTGPSFTANQSKWGIGLYDDGVGTTYDDVFVFRVDANTTDSSIKAELDRDGNFAIKGSYTTSNSYSKGKFVQSYHTRCVSSDLYINPFSESSATSANVSSSTENPFAVAPFAGEIKKIKIITADTDLTAFTSGARFEISVVNASSGGVNEQLNSFSSIASSAPTSLPSNGVVAQFALKSVSAAGTVYSFESFSGSAAFTEGQLVQYRISQVNGAATDINSTIMSTVSFTID